MESVFKKDMMSPRSTLNRLRIKPNHDIPIGRSRIISSNSFKDALILRV